MRSCGVTLDGRQVVKFGLLNFVTIDFRAFQLCIQPGCYSGVLSSVLSILVRM